MNRITIMKETFEHTVGEVVLYQPNDTIKLEVMVEDDTVWLSQAQMSELFNTTRANITLHIRNIFKEGELVLESVCKESLHTASDGKRYKTKYYNLDVIISVGYRVKSIIGTRFRQWANSVLKNYILKGYAYRNQLESYSELSNRIDRQNDRLLRLENAIENHQQQLDFFVRTNVPPVEGVFYEGQVLDARVFAESLIKSAHHEIILIDNYIDSRTFEILESRGGDVIASIYVERVGSGLRNLQDIAYQQSGRRIDLYNTPMRFHDRFLIIDDVVYHIGASLNDLGKKLFAFSKLGLSKDMILGRC